MKRNRLLMVALAIGIPVVMLLLLISVTGPAEAANPSVTIYQCANGKNGEDPKCEGSGNNGWITGKVGTNKANYQLGDFVAYRYVFDNLVSGSRYCFGTWWDIAKSDLPAIDYIGSYNITITQANPLHNTSVPSSPMVTIPMPSDQILTTPFKLGGNTFTGTLPFGSVGQTGSQGVLTLWGGGNLVAKPYSLNATSAITTNLNNASQSLEFCFTASGSESVLAWGGHIANPSEWGAPDKPSGSPYHMRTGTVAGYYTNPRDGISDLAEFDPSFPDNTDPSNANHYNIGSQDLQLGVDDPTAITLKSVSAGDGNDGLTLALVGVGVVALVSVMIIIARRNRMNPT